MVQSHFALSWDSYKSNISSGFSALQQNGEFVDMTLAADGYFVKVHQVLIAMSSPYLKELISSAPCPHPVIFLNNISHKTLSCLLEYLYTGEVLVPSENLMSFVNAAKALHIKGLENLNTQGKESEYRIVDNISQMDSSIPCHMTGLKKLGVPSDNGSKTEIDLPAAARKVLLRYQKPLEPINDKKQACEVSNISNNKQCTERTEPVMSDHEVMDTSEIPDSDDELDTSTNMTQPAAAVDPPNASNLQFSMSIRGSLQVILNRYIYNLHSTTRRTAVRRWRCVEYRNHRCKAFVVTRGNVVLNRANLHNHAFHDKKILQKIEKKAVFSALDDAQSYKDKEYPKEQADTNLDSSNEQDEFVVLDYNVQNWKPTEP